jgi:hypothetical protein
MLRTAAPCLDPRGGLRPLARTLPLGAVPPCALPTAPLSPAPSPQPHPLTPKPAPTPPRPARQFFGDDWSSLGELDAASLEATLEGLTAGERAALLTAMGRIDGAVSALEDVDLEASEARLDLDDYLRRRAAAAAARDGGGEGGGGREGGGEGEGAAGPAPREPWPGASPAVMGALEALRAGRTAPVDPGGGAEAGGGSGGGARRRWGEWGRTEAGGAAAGAAAGAAGDMDSRVER